MGCTGAACGLAVDTGGRGAANMGAGKPGCSGGVGLGGRGAELGWGAGIAAGGVGTGAVELQGLLRTRLEDTVVGGGQL